MHAGATARQVMRLGSVNRPLQPFLLPISSRFLPNGAVFRTTQRYFATITRTPYKKQQFLSTLDPNKLLPSDFQDISNKKFPTIWLSKNPVYFKERPQIYFDARQPRPPFPSHAQGFFYYHVPANSPLASSIRFRCTPSNDPATFSDGQDLLSPNGLPWQRSLRSILAMRTPYLRDQFLKTGIVTEDQVTRIRRIFGQELTSPLVVLHQLDQPFPLKFHHLGLYLSAIIRDKLFRFSIMGIFVDRRLHVTKGNVKGRRPYQGSAVARFELSTLSEHSGHDTIVLRILKLVDPPTCTIPGYDGHVPVPIEGELVRCQHRVWHRRIDAPGRATEVFNGLVKDL